MHVTGHLPFVDKSYFETESVILPIKYLWEDTEVFFLTNFVWTNYKERLKFITVIFCTLPLTSILRGMYIMDQLLPGFVHFSH